MPLYEALTLVNELTRRESYLNLRVNLDSKWIVFPEGADVGSSQRGSVTYRMDPLS